MGCQLLCETSVGDSAKGFTRSPSGLHSLSVTQVIWSLKEISTIVQAHPINRHTAQARDSTARHGTAQARLGGRGGRGGPAADMPLAKDLVHPSLEDEKRNHKKKRLVQSPNSYFMDVKCPGCYKITTVFSHAQTVVLCVGCSTVLCQPTGGKAKLTEASRCSRLGQEPQYF
ncbi:ribosomal protein eS27-like [Cinclus cinclus]|uniref:ribosomal protein eS27-like n=1 Tax=Cinclus cinclus TaxID=127875 RepID=UPI002E1321DC